MELKVSTSELKPIWEWKVGNSVWLRFPIWKDRIRAIIYFIAGAGVGVEMLVNLLANGHHRWIWLVGGTAAFLQTALGISSLWALRIQRKRLLQDSRRPDVRCSE